MESVQSGLPTVGVPKVTFHKKLQQLLESKALSVHELAQQAGVPYTTLKAYFQKKKDGRHRLPTFGVVVAICKSLDVPTDYFADCSDWKSA